jgi:hypothetical protein
MESKEIIANQSAYYGLLAEFKDAHALIEAAEKAKNEGFRKMDAFTPFPVHGLDEALGLPKTRLAAVVLFGGITGVSLAYFTQWYASTIHYPIIVGGKPYHSWPAFIPISFELTILFASLTAAIVMILRNGLPTLYHPLFNVPRFEAASKDAFFLCIEASDPKFSLEGTKSFLQSLGAVGVYEVQP